MDAETITQGAVGLGLLAAGAWNGWLSLQARREARSTTREVKELAKPVAETARQVTKNGRTSNPPTLLDQLHDIKEGQTVAARMFEGHIERSSREWGHMWDAIHAVQAHVGLPPTDRDHHHDDV